MILRSFVIVSLWFIQNTAQAALIQLSPNDNAVEFSIKNQVTLKEVSKALRLYEAEELDDDSSAQLFRARTSRASGTHVKVFPNHPVQWRGPVAGKSNDPFANLQWNWLLDPTTIGVNAVQSWNDFGTGGKTALQQEIVIAIVDGGFDYKHPDLSFNRWRNWNEIAGNGKDDDGNGYVDDIHGWDIQSNSGKIDMADHGTHVAGIIGARGNNYIGITGLNWRIKIMYVSMGDSLADTASTMSAYNYILKQKELWLASGGTKGANVVAVNSSFGIDAAPCSSPEYSIWNEMIEKLGEKGILSVAATSNLEINVDKYGDIPTSCSSPYLITVTSNGRSGNKSSGTEWNPLVENNPSDDNYGAGFGSVSIDIAAPGEGILSTAMRTSFNSTKPYSASSGTSFSTPHVAGAIGYLHSVVSGDFQKRALREPGQAAMDIKEALLKTVTPIASLKTQTVSGGVLNVHAASLFIEHSNLQLANQ